MIRPGIAQVLSAGRRLGTRSYSTAKPELSQFSKPLTSTFFLASGVYTTMHFIWWRLENDERKKAYKVQIDDLENELKAKLAKL